MIQVNTGECSISKIALEQGQDSHLTSNQQFRTHSYFLGWDSKLFKKI